MLKLLQSFLWCIFLFQGASAQYRPLDTFSLYLSKQPDFYLSLDGRNSFIRDKPALIDGIRFGLSYGGKIRLLLGAYDLRTPIYRTYVYRQGTSSEETRIQRSDLFYMAFTMDYVAFRNRKWKLTVPIQTGFGWGNRRETNMAEELRVDRDFSFIPLEISFGASYNILDWLSAGAGIGYRYSLFSNALSGDFSAPIYTYGLSLDPSIIYYRYIEKHLKTG